MKKKFTVLEYQQTYKTKTKSLLEQAGQFLKDCCNPTKGTLREYARVFQKRIMIGYNILKVIRHGMLCL